MKTIILALSLTFLSTVAFAQESDIVIDTPTESYVAGRIHNDDGDVIVDQQDDQGNDAGHGEFDNGYGSITVPDSDSDIYTQQDDNGDLEVEVP